MAPEHSPEPVNRLCQKCFSPIGKFRAQVWCSCGKSSSFSYFSWFPSWSDQFAAGILKKRMERDNLVDGTEFFLFTGSNPFQVQVGTNDNKASRRTVSQISVQIIKELQIVLELYLNRTKQMISVLQNGKEKKSSILSDIFGKLQEIEDIQFLLCWQDIHYGRTNKL